MDFLAVVDQAIALLRQRGRVTYRTLKRQFQLYEAALENLKVELIEGQRLATAEQGTVLVWTALAAAIDLYRAMEVTFWLPQAEAALAQAVG